MYCCSTIIHYSSRVLSQRLQYRRVGSQSCCFESVPLMNLLDIVSQHSSLCMALIQNFLCYSKSTFVGGTVASWLVRSTPERVIRVQALAGDIALCSWARHLTLTVTLSTQVYKLVPVTFKDKVIPESVFFCQR